MSMISQADLDQIIRLNRSISEINSVDELRQTTLEKMEEIYHASCSMFLLRPAGSSIATFDRSVTRGMDIDLPRIYSQQALVLDPFARTLLSQPGIELNPQVRTGSQIVSYSKLSKTLFYREYMRPFNLHHMLRIELVIGHRSIATLGLFRPSNEPDFSEPDCTKATLSASTLANALARAIQQESFQENMLLLEKSAPLVTRVGLLVLDEDLTVIYCDANAQNWMQHGDDNSTSTHSILSSELAEPLRAYSARIKKNEPLTELQYSVEYCAGRKKASFQAHLRAHHTAQGQWRILVYILPEEFEQNSIERLVDCGLTQREAEIAQLVSSGLRNYEIATELGISLNTVQSHLSKVFRKMNISCRAELIARITGPYSNFTLAPGNSGR